MIALLDTHLLLWAAGDKAELPAAARALIERPDIELVFSVASIWEVAIKSGLGRPDFDVDPRILRRGLIGSGYVELPITGEHAAALADLPPIHRDPFDRMLIAQAQCEGLALVTADAAMARYGSPVRLV